MIPATASAIYGAIAARRRRWYESDPARQRRLSRPVVSIGNLRAGGAGKTPVVAALARLLTSRGERPSILTRGYAREVSSDGVTVVSDGRRIIEGIETAGDEALMLARELADTPVLVGADRYLSGCLAERRFGVTVHLLDDGFQHLALARDLDLLLVDEEDLSDSLLPGGRLREPITTAARADALLTSASVQVCERFLDVPGVTTVFRVTRALGTPRWLQGSAGLKSCTTSTPVFGIAGIARPQRFFDDLTAAGWKLTGSLNFRDHHVYKAADLERIAQAARASGASVVLTTEKDAVKLEKLASADRSIAAVPLTVTFEPAFLDWLWARTSVWSAGV